MTLQSGRESRDFLIIGAEGDVEKEHVKNYPQLKSRLQRTIRGQLWMSGRLVRDEGHVKFRHEFGGFLDHGPFYAANSFVDPRTNRRIVYGWLPEEDLPSDLIQSKGWNGSLAIPREIFLLRLSKVKGALRSKLTDVSCFQSTTEADGSTTLLTLGIRPLEEFKRLRDTCSRKMHMEGGIKLPFEHAWTKYSLFDTTSSAWELEAVVSVLPGCETFGFRIHEDPMTSTHVSVIFSVHDESITVDRSASTTDSRINTCPDAGPFTLFSMASAAGSDASSLEQLRLRLFSDGHVLEVFANDRFALATMIYSDGQRPGVGGISALASGAPSTIVLDSVRLWDGLEAVTHR